MVRKTIVLMGALACCVGVGCAGLETGNQAGERPVRPQPRGWQEEDVVTFGTITTIFALPETQDHWPRGRLAGVGFQPDEDPDDGTIAPGKPLLFCAIIDDARRTRLSKLMQPGHRAWITATDVGEVYAVTAIEVTGDQKAGAIPTRAIAAEVTIEFVDLGAWHNRMPPSTDTRHLVLNLRVTNDSGEDSPLQVRRVFYSFDKSREGMVTEEPLTFINPDTGMPGRDVEQMLAAQSTGDWTLRATDAFPAGHENEEMFITLILGIGDEQVVLRKSGTIIVAY